MSLDCSTARRLCPEKVLSDAYRITSESMSADIRPRRTYFRDPDIRSSSGCYKKRCLPCSSSSTFNMPYIKSSNNHASGSGKKLRVALIPGDGIGGEVMVEGLRAMRAAAKRWVWLFATLTHRFNIDIDLDESFYEWATCDRYVEKGAMLPDDWKKQLEGFDAIYFGAVGDPSRVPDHISLWGSLIQFRREFDQYISLRPCRLLPGIKCPLADKKIGDIDFWVVRENTEGEYSSVGGKMFPGTDREFVVQDTIMTRQGVDRVLEYAFTLAQKRPRKKLTSATKSNGISISMPYWDERVKEMSTKFPDVSVDKYHIDILTAWFVLRPEMFDVVVGSVRRKNGANVLTIRICLEIFSPI